MSVTFLSIGHPEGPMIRRADAVIVALMLLVVAGLILPAVGRVLEASRRISCRNNLWNLGHGLEGHIGWRGHFPPGTVANPDLPPDRRLSWHVEVWGFMIGGWKLLLDKDLAWDADANREPKYGVGPRDQHQVVEIGQLTWLTCPANLNRAGPGTVGLAHYVGVAGVGDDAALLPKEDKRAGVFGYDRKTRLEDIKDGTSTTLLVVETATDNGPWTAGGRPTVRGLESDRRPYLSRQGQFSSYHRGDVTNALFVDGSVRSIGPGIDPKVFEALSTIAGGEEVGHIGDG
jgi:prepilin-type processing-associated H-X9-DG protein